jgi:PAS domain S-box-containing protein
VTSRNRVNILLVDDQPANLLVMQTVLGSLDENLICVNSGEEALRAVLQMDFAVILLDVRMPTMSGFDTARLIRSRSRSSRVAILFITAAVDAGFPIEEAYALGAVDYLTKPILPTVLRAKVSFFVDLYRKTEELANVERARHAAALNAKDERIRLILDNARDYAFIGTDIDGQITEWEGGAESITGWSAAEALGRPLEVVFTAEDQETKIFEIEMHRTRQTGRAEDKRWHLRKDGKKFFADGVMVALNDDAGHMRGFAKIFRDATAEWQAADNFRVSQERFSLLVNSSGEGIYGMGLDFSCTFLNAAGAAMLGYRPEEVVGRTIHDLIHYRRADGSPYPISESPIVRAAREGVSIRVHDEVFWRKDGTAVPILYSVSPMVVDGKTEGVVVTFTDITERKHAEDELRRVAAELSEANRRKTEFLATLAHELRNPLAPLRNGLQVMRLAAADPAAVARAREIMDRQLSLLVHLVNDLLDVARITHGNVELKKEWIELRTVLDSAVETSLPLIEASGHALTVDIPVEPLTLEVDPTRIAQVVSNLLNNAAKYTPPGGKIALSAWCDADELHIAVTDSGVGIPPDSLHMVFEMFAQLRQNRDRAQGGLGIGLTLVRRLVELHGGTVSASSSGSDGGSTFNVRLPLVGKITAIEPDAGPVKDADAGAAAFRVLVVDDNVDAASTLATMLEITGHTTSVANDGFQALHMVQEFLPDVIFLDIGMPGMNGYEVARALRKIPGMERTVLIALTGWGSENDRARSKEAGFDHHLTKPVGLAGVNELFVKLGRRPA